MPSNKSHNQTPAGGKKGRRSFAGQRMEDAGVARGGAGSYNWGNPMEDYEDDYEAWDEDFQEQKKAELAEQKAAEREYRRAEEAERAAKEAYINAQKAKKEALQKHAAMNPYAMLEVEGAQATAPLDFAFAAPPAPHFQGPHPSMTPRQMRREDAEFNAAIAEHRRIMRAEGMLASPAGHPACSPVHPSMGPVHAPVPVAAFERQLEHDEHMAQMQVAHAAHQYQARHHFPMQQQPYHRNGPNEKANRTRFQPRGHARFGH